MEETKQPSLFDYFLGTELLEYGEGKAKVSLKIKPHHLNIGKSTHGGVISSLCDVALSAAATTLFQGTEDRVVTMNMSVSFLRGSGQGDELFATGEIIKKGSTILYIEGEITNQDGKMIARAQGNWFVKRAKK